MERIGDALKGIYRDVLKDRDNNIIFDSGWKSNLIVKSCRELLSAFMKNDTPTSGIQCLKVGQGNPLWDEQGTPKPEPGDKELKDPNPFVIDVSKLEIVYLNEQDAPVPGPSSRLQITATLGIDEPPPPQPTEPQETPLSSYPLREFGLFGKYGTESYMIDCIRHPVIHKDASTTLVRVVRLYF